METLGKISAITFIGCVAYLMVTSYALRWMIDGAKVQSEGPELFRRIAPPKRILTPLGVKIWWSRWIAGAMGLVCLIVAFNLKPAP